MRHGPNTVEKHCDVGAGLSSIFRLNQLEPSISGDKINLNVMSIVYVIKYLGWSHCDKILFTSGFKVVVCSQRSRFTQKHHGDIVFHLGSGNCC